MRLRELDLTSLQETPTQWAIYTKGGFIGYVRKIAYEGSSYPDEQQDFTPFIAVSAQTLSRPEGETSKIRIRSVQEGAAWLLWRRLAWEYEFDRSDYYAPAA